MPNYTVTQVITVEVDESKFTPQFLKEFREQIYELDTLDDHLEFLAEKYATGRIQGHAHEFVEGYGRLGDMGILLGEVSCEVEPEFPDGE